MPLDVITLNAVAKELNDILSGGRIEKIYQPENDEILMQVKADGKPFNLAISANTSNPRIHLTSYKKENAPNAPAFCMLLRKYLSGGRILSTEIFNTDRIIKISIEKCNELYDNANYFLMVELMGRYSNIILLNKDFVIIDSIRRIHPSQSTIRYILPDSKYIVQPHNKIRLDDSQNLKYFFEQNNNCTFESLMDNISGISKETAKEILSKNNRLSEINTLLGIYENPRFCPCIRILDNTVKDYYVTPYKTLNGEYKPMSSINHALDYYYGIYDCNERKKTNTKEITQILKRLEKRIDNRIKDNLNKIKESEKCEQLRQKGELILSNIYKIKNCDTILQCYDYYNNVEKTIELDSRLTPAENAQQYFRHYNKLKKGKEFAEQLLKNLYLQSQYIENIKISIENCETKQEFEEIKEELLELSGIRKTFKNKKIKQKKSVPLNIKVDGFDVFIGKNSFQNNQVTFEIGNGGDTWLHAKNYHGCHIIIKGEPNISVISKVAKLAAYFSGGRNSDKVEVDYTLRKYVKKIPAAPLGLVTYTNHSSILVKPDFFIS